MLTSPWAALLPAALAGTRRQPFAPLPGFSPSLGSEADAPEKSLLLTAANLALVQRAGQRFAGPAGRLGRPLAETLPALGPELVALLGRLATDPALKPVHEICFRLAAGWRLPHRALAQYLRQHPVRHHHQLLAYSTLGGTRGQWMLPWHSNDYLRMPQPPPETATWWADDETVRHGNIWYLARHRPPHGWDWLWQAWETGSPEQRHALARILEKWTIAEPLPADFYPRLAALYADWPAGHEPPLLLAQLPGNAQLESYWVIAQQLLSWPPGTPHPVVALPAAAPVPEWVAARPPATASQLPRWSVWVLGSFLHWTRPSRWADLWGVSADEALAGALASDHAELLLGAWVRAAARFRDLPAIRALLVLPHTRPDLIRYADQGYDFLRLLSYLPPAELVAWRLQWLPALPHAPFASPAQLHAPGWLFWASAYSSTLPSYPVGLMLSLVQFMRDYLAQPAPTPDPNAPVEEYLGNLLAYYTEQAADEQQLVEAIETGLLPLARTQPGRPLARAVLRVWPALAFCREFATGLGLQLVSLRHRPTS